MFGCFVCASFFAHRFPGKSRKHGSLLLTAPRLTVDAAGGVQAHVQFPFVPFVITKTSKMVHNDEVRRRHNKYVGGKSMLDICRYCCDRKVPTVTATGRSNTSWLGGGLERHISAI